MDIAHIIEKETKLLFRGSEELVPLPSVTSLNEMLSNLNTVIFNDFNCKCGFSEDRLRHILYEVYLALLEQSDIAFGIGGHSGSITSESLSAREIAKEFIGCIHTLKELLYKDVHAIMHNDPAARSPHEVISSYPAIRALLYYRVAHRLLEMGVPILPRMITEMAHSATGIDIHPGAKIGEYFGIDHGTGVVIGETCIIGDHVTLYQGVTLGARNFEYDDNGNPKNIARHPIIEDNVTIYSNTSVLGRITVGHDTIIGGNVWLTHSVAPYSRIIQGAAVGEIGSK